MPQIPIVSAQTGPGILDLPPIERQTGFDELEQLGERFSSIDAKIRAQQDDLDLYRTVTDVEVELAQIRHNVSVDPDYETQAEHFGKLANELKYRKLDTLRSPAVAAVAQARIERMIAEAGIHVQTEAMKRRVEQQHTERVQLGQHTAKRWADADTSEQRMQIEQEYDELVQRGASHPKAKEKLRTDMREHAMEYLRLTNRPKLRELDSHGAFRMTDPLKRAENLRKARQDDEHDQNIERENFNRAKQVYLQGQWALANQGLLPQSWIEQAKKGLDPFVDPKSVDDLEERNLNPIAGAGSQQVQSVMHEYYMGRATPDRIERARQQLLKLERQGVTPAATSKALKELQGVEAARSNAALQAGFDAIQRELDAEERPFMPGRIGETIKHKRRIEQGQMEKELSEGKSLEQILRERRERRRLEDEQRKQRRSHPEDDASTILEGLRSR